MNYLNINKSLIFFINFILLFTLIPKSLKAGDEINRDFIRVISENDSYGPFTDRYYTSGNRFEYFSGDLFSLPGYFTNKLFNLKPEEHCEKYANYCTKLETSGISLNQLIYTPANVGGKDVYRGDRPYAGVFYLSSSYSTVLKNGILYSEWKAGIVGPNSQGERFQGAIHRFFSFNEPVGWNHQIKNKPAANFDTQYISPITKNIAIHNTLGLGNLDLYYRFGLYLRFGKVHSKNTFTGLSIRDPGQGGVYREYPIESDDSEYYFFIYPYFKYQGYNITLGNTDSYPDWNTRGILSDKNFEEKDRLLLFKYGLLSRNSSLDPVQEYLLFNSYFNNFSPPDEKRARVLLEYLTNKEDFDDFNILLYYNLISPRTNIEYGYSKFLALKKSLTESNIDPEKYNLIYLLAYLNGEFDYKKEFTTKPKKFQGILQSGFVIKSENFFGVISWQLTSTDFYVRGDIPKFHLFGTVQLGIRF
ncbi:MAG: lipid A deacylase LpxR family protein [Leptospiraceae bacterium]|nr:lipid A deacylase LpxR family protein [Leptospiraceae bacterium]